MEVENSEIHIHFPSPGVFNFKAGLLWIIPRDDAPLCPKSVRTPLLLMETSVSAEKNTSCPHEKCVSHHFSVKKNNKKNPYEFNNIFLVSHNNKVGQGFSFHLRHAAQLNMILIFIWFIDRRKKNRFIIFCVWADWLQKLHQNAVPKNLFSPSRQ